MDKLITLRVIAVVEATSFLALLVAAYFKHSDKGEGAVAVLGPIHGLLFLAFVAVAVLNAQRRSWPAKTTTLVLLGAVIPFGGYFVERHFAQEQD
jgi:integral membrane protein